MKLERFTEAAQARIDHDLKTFPALISFYLNAADRVKVTGKKVVAKGPLSPVEVIYAAEALAYDVSTHNTLQAIFNGRTDLSQHAVDTGISPDLSPWNLVMLGAVLSGQNDIPIDLLSTAFDGVDEQLIKSFQLMAHVSERPLRFWEVPKYDPESEGWALNYLKKELEQLFEWMEVHTGHKVTKESLQRAIHFGNLIRTDMVELNAYLAMVKVPITALEYYFIQMMMGDYAQDPEGLHNLFRQFLNEIDLRVDKGKSAPGISASPVRIYIMGKETQELHVFNAIEDYGGVVVGCDFRLPLYYEMIDEQTLPLESLAHWIWRMPSNLPIQERVRFELNYIKKQNPNAVIISNVVGSRCLSGAERLVRDLVKRELSVPVLSIETTLPQENVEKVDYQIRALLQTIGS